jgi:hypothetical protein
MRLFESVLATLAHLQRPPQKCLMQLMRLLLMLPGPVTFRHLRRDRPSHERTFARPCARAVAFVALPKAAMMRVVPPDHEQALVRDASFVPQSGQHTYGLARFWNGTQRRTEKGRERSALGWLEGTDNCADRLRVAPTPPTGPAAAPEATRLESYLDHVTRRVQPSALYPRRYVVTDGYSSTPQFLKGVRDIALQQRGTWRRDAHRRYRDNGPPRSGPGRPKPSDGQVHGSERSRFERGASGDEGIVLYPQVGNHVPCNRHRRVVMVVETGTNRSARLLSPDLELAAARLYGYDHARFQMACLCRDAQQCTGLSDCQARSQA